MWAAESPMEQGGPFIVALVMLVLLFAPMIANEKRKRRGEAPAHRPLAVTSVAVLVAAAAAALLATILNAIPWGIAASSVSLAASFIGLMSMLERGVPRGGAAPPAADAPAPPGAGPRAAAAEAAGPRLAWLAVAAQIAGILSLVVSVVALVLT